MYRTQESARKEIFEIISATLPERIVGRFLRLEENTQKFNVAFTTPNGFTFRSDFEGCPFEMLKHVAAGLGVPSKSLTIRNGYELF